MNTKITLILCVFLGALVQVGCSVNHSLSAPIDGPDVVDLRVEPCDDQIGSCGARAAVSVLDYHDRKISSDQKIDAENHDFLRRRFVTTLDMISFLREAGVIVTWGAISERDLIAAIKSKEPVIVSVPTSNAPAEWETRACDWTHCWVVRGISEKRRIFRVNDPDTGLGEISFASLDLLRSRCGRFGIVCHSLNPQRKKSP